MILFSEPTRKTPKFEKALDIEIMILIKQFLAGSILISYTDRVSKRTS